ncbi:MAG: CotH kinase family protein, partial [Verrucomicrobiales bacterium]|nr:CotH kinase family protein [Verrucomicrobiales bacterium]
MKTSHLPALACLLAATSAGAQVRINEFMAANATTYPDNADFDDYSDWIELHNTGDSNVSLNGYYLSDDPTEPLKWPIPADASIPANGFFVVRADGFDAAPDETYRRDAAPWSNFQTEYYHTNFKLSAGGESVVLSKLDAPIQDLTFLPRGAAWVYFDKGSLPAANWFAPSFDDSTWTPGTAEFGYGDGDEETIVSFGPDGNNKYRTTYFRTTFNITDPAKIATLSCRAIIDDGAVFYVNGNEVDRLRIPDGPVDFDTDASSGREGTLETITLPASALVAGINHIAVEVHQGSLTSSDVSFDLQITGTESAGDPTVVDTVDYGYQIDDVSYGRTPGDGDAWTFFGESTPDAPNTTLPTSDRTQSSPVTSSPSGGFYASAQSVTLTAPSGTIRYTLDGSVPRSTSPAYTSPIPLDSTGVLRTRTFESGKIPGELGTHTYFIGEPERPLPVVAFTVEPEHFFDNTTGIYDNVYKGREAANTLEYYAPDRTPAFKVNSGTKIGGENIWRFDQKPLNIAMRGKYGDDLINYQIFPGENIGSYDAVGFRNGGDNWPNAMLRDPMSPSIVKGQMQNDVAFYQPVVLYLNGDYRGIHNARLRMGDSYFFNRYGIQPGGYDLLVKEHAPPSGSTQLVVKDGTADAYTSFEDFIENNDMADPTNYQNAIAQIDLDNFMDYCAMTDFVYESSWHHNQEFWRERKSGAKWRWNINDIDRGFNTSNVTSSLLDDLDDRHPIFTALIDNPGFVNRFVQRYAAHLSSTYHPDRIADIIQSLADEVEPEIQRHVDKWDDRGGFSVSRRNSEIAEIKEFAVDRTANVFDDMARILDVTSSTADLSLTISPPAAGKLSINGVPMLPQYATTVELYQGIAFDLTAAAAPGYSFTGWSTGISAATISKT